MSQPSPTPATEKPTSRTFRSSYDLTQIPNYLITLPGEVHEAEREVEVKAYERDKAKLAVELKKAKAITLAKADKLTEAGAKAKAEVDAEAESLEFIEADYRYRLARADFNKVQNKLMSTRQLASKFMEKDQGW